MALIDWIICNYAISIVIGGIVSALLGKFAGIKVALIFGFPITVGIIAGILLKTYLGIGC